jgi:transcriptional regulator with XRE-family HTH domain
MLASDCRACTAAARMMALVAQTPVKSGPLDPLNRGRTMSTTTPLSIDRQLQAIVQTRELSAYGVARLAGVSPRVVQRWLRGERDILLETAARIALVLGVKLVAPRRRSTGRDVWPLEALDLATTDRAPAPAELGALEHAAGDGPELARAAAAAEPAAAVDDCFPEPREERFHE